MSVAGVNSNSNTAQTNGGQATSNTSADSSLQSIESTFLTLLVQELQNQDPTAPMDSTQMVGQMISLNQLDQLASINQVVTNALGSSSAPVSGGASGE
jgi:flagellar basal-body rod modification protein FlgD